MARPRVVIESRRPAAAAALAGALTESGIDPVVCAGPDESGHGCPLLADEPCALIEGADAVVYDLDLEQPADREVLRSLVVEHGGLPIVTERSTEEARQYRSSLQQCAVVVPYSTQYTAAAVVRALSNAGVTRLV